MQCHPATLYHIRSERPPDGPYRYGIDKQFMAGQGQHSMLPVKKLDGAPTILFIMTPDAQVA
jgi:hypothetical protein